MQIRQGDMAFTARTRGKGALGLTRSRGEVASCIAHDVPASGLACVKPQQTTAPSGDK